MKQKLLNVKILTPEKTIFSGEADMVIIPGEHGEFGVLPMHTPLISTLKDGILKLSKQDKLIGEFVIFKGYCQIFYDEIMILTEFALDIASVDIVKIKHNIESLEEKLIDHNESHTKTIILQDLTRNKLIVEYLEK